MHQVAWEVRNHKQGIAGRSENLWNDDCNPDMTRLQRHDMKVSAGMTPHWKAPIPCVLQARHTNASMLIYTLQADSASADGAEFTTLRIEGMPLYVASEQKAQIQ